ncbi:MAG: hypothetical protein UY04_C0015G0047, partial [Parcubacteria group bacterium GW2011_GWA2_47_7]
MPNNERVGSDGFSQEVFDSTLGKLEDLGIVYVAPSPERNADEEWKMLNEQASREAKNIIATLDRLSTNAKRITATENLRQDYHEIIPKIREAKEKIHKTVYTVSGMAPQ